MAGLDGETQDTPNDSLEHAIGRAITASGGTVLSPPTVDDSDVASITSNFYSFAVLCQYYLLDTIWGNWPYVDQKDGDTEQKLNQLADRLTEKQAAIEKQLADPALVDALKVPPPPLLVRIKSGSIGFMTPVNPFKV